MDSRGNGDSCSVIICCYSLDRWDVLRAAIEGATKQLRDDDELIIVVDYNVQLLETLQTEYGEVAAVVPNKDRPGLSGARNTGVAHAATPLVVFLDDDATPDTDWLNELVQPFADLDIVGVGGRANPVWPAGDAPWWMPIEFLWVVGCSYRGLPEIKASIRNPIGCNMAFRRDAIDAVGGFSADLGRVKDKPVGGEETDVAIRVRAATGSDILHVPDAVVNHAVTPSRTTVGYFIRRCYSEGKSKAVLARRVGAGDATSAERSYLGTLATGVTKRLAATFREKSLAPLGQIAMLGLGLGLTTAGFALGTIASLVRRPQ